MVTMYVPLYTIYNPLNTAAHIKVPNRDFFGYTIALFFRQLPKSGSIGGLYYITSLRVLATMI